MQSLNVTPESVSSESPAPAEGPASAETTAPAAGPPQASNDTDENGNDKRENTEGGKRSPYGAVI